MVKIRLNGQRYEMAGCWEELKTRHYQRIMSEWNKGDLATRDYFQLFCILTDTDFKDYHATSENEVTIYNCIRWVIEQDYDFPKEVPRFLEVGGKVLEIPKKIGMQSIGQNIAAMQELNKHEVKDACLSYLVAVYLQPQYHGKMDLEKVPELEDKIKEMPIHLIRTLGFFLQKSVQNYGRKSMSAWHRILTSLNMHSLSRFLS